MANQPTKYSKFLVGAASAALVATAVAPVASAADFKDTKGNTHEEAIKALSAAGVISGYADGTFKPNKTLTRSDVVKMMGKWLVSEGYKVPTDYKTNVRFTDLKSTSNDELLQYAAVVKDNGVFIGSNDRLLAGDDISRENMAVVIVRAFDRVHDIDLASYVAGQDFKKDVTDLGKAKAEARPAIDVLDFFDITNPAAPAFNPKATTTRGQFASFLNKTLTADFSKVTGQVAEGVASVKAVNATTVEVTMKDKVENINSLHFKIDGLTVSNAAVKQTDDKTVVLTTAVQKGGEKYTVTLNEKAIGSFTGISNVLPEKVSMITTSQQGVVGKEVTVRAEVAVAKDESKAGIPVTFNIVSSNKSINKDHVVEVKTNADGIAEYSYTQYSAGEDTVQAYATGKANVRTHGKVYWANAIQLGLSELTTGNDLSNETKKSYKVAGKANTTYYIAIKENLDVTPDKVTPVKVQSHATQAFVTPYELTTGGEEFATVTTNSNGEGSFTIHGTNLVATPIVYLPSSVNSDLKDYSYSASALQAQAPTVKFSQVDSLAITVAGEGTANSAEYTSIPTAHNTNSAGGRTYTVTVMDKAGKIAPAGTVAYVAFADMVGDVYFTTEQQNFKKVVKGDVQQLTVGKDGKVQFRVAGQGATTYVKPTVFLNTAGDISPVKLDAADVQAAAEVTYFKSPVVSNAVLTIRDAQGNVITSQVANTDAYFTYQSVDQNGFAYRPGNYTVTPGSTTIIYVQKVDPITGVVTFVPQEITNPAITLNTYQLAFDVTSTFGNATVKDLSGNVLNATQNLGNTKTYKVASDVNGKAVVRVTSNNADTVTVNVTGASGILPTQAATVTFTSDSGLPTVITNATVQWANINNNTFKLATFAKVIDYTNADLYIENSILGIPGTGHSKAGISQFELYISSSDVVTVLTDANGKYSIYLNTNNSGTNNGPVVVLGNDGKVELNKTAYAKNENINITVTDADFAGNSVSNESFTVMLKNGTLAVPVTVTETGDTGVFTATVTTPLTGSLVAGTIKVEYVDALTANGSTNEVRVVSATQSGITGVISIATETTAYQAAQPAKAAVYKSSDITSTIGAGLVITVADGTNTAANISLAGLTSAEEVKDAINVALATGTPAPVAAVATVEGNKVVITSTATGSAATVVVSASTVAQFTNAAPIGVANAVAQGAKYAFNVTAAPLAGETVTVGSKTYLVTANGSGPVAGTVELPTTVNATNFANALATAITAQDTTNWTASNSAGTITLTQVTPASGSTAPTVSVK